MQLFCTITTTSRVCPTKNVKRSWSMTTGTTTWVSRSGEEREMLRKSEALSTISNPFHGVVVQDVWQPLALDVSSIQENAFNQCLRALENVSAGESDSLLIYGAPGAGKTHLLSRF